MTGCTTPFTESAALEGTAAAHNTYIASQPADWLNGSFQDGMNTYSNAHLNPDGKASWDDGGPIANAGYNTQRGEIVAWGQADEAAAVVKWMQDDETRHHRGGTATSFWIVRRPRPEGGISRAVPRATTGPSTWALGSRRRTAGRIPRSVRMRRKA